MAGDKKFTTLKPAGYVSITFPEGIVEHDTVQCVHCGMHWHVDPLTAKGRGFCFACNGPICGKLCLKCVPIEKDLDIMEGKRTGTEVSVPVLWTPFVKRK